MLYEFYCHAAAVMVSAIDAVRVLRMLETVRYRDIHSPIQFFNLFNFFSSSNSKSRLTIGVL